MKKLLLTFMAGFTIMTVSAQSRNCPMSLDMNMMQIQNPARYQRFINLENFTTNYINNQSGASYRLADPNGIIIIPVVVHVLHRNEAEGTGLNISLAQIQSQIAVLNEDFRRLNANRVNTPAAFTGVASDYNFEFRLACQDPNGNVTNGVTRRFTNKTGFQFSANNDGTANDNSIGIKFTNSGGEDAWPTNRYLNIWVGNFTDGTLGYATWPGDFATSPNVDGVVVSTTAMGRTGNVAAPYDGGRTATHEVGHWLNLRHIWGDATCGDDFVADTPVQQNSNFGCPTFPLTVANPNLRWNGPRCNAADPSSMFMNYMDYTDDNCMNIFTNGQRLRGRAIFAAGGPRAAFLDNYFQIQQPGNIICTGTVNLRNPNCLQPTWTIVSGPATVTSVGTNQVSILANGTGTVTLRAVAGNYLSEINVSVNNSVPNNPTTVPSGNNIITMSVGQVMNVTASSQSATSYGWTYTRTQGTGSNGLSLYPYSPYGVPNQSCSIEANRTGQYRVFVSASNNCGSTAPQGRILINVQSGSSGQQLRVAAYPNPAQQDLNVQYVTTSDDLIVSTSEKTETKDFSVKLYNGSNQEVRSGSSAVGKLILDIRDLKDGIYYLRVVDGETVKTMQIQIKR